ncbi:MAG: hypothetical protein V5804_08675 [Mucilaginibacter sp.]|uniref:hypothetical protein n=1 Tax=Mucilaginibacter sp. TaxID=1882438 RepID=UPI0034E37EFB
MLSLLWNGNPTQTTFTLNEDKVGVGNWGYVSYFPKVGASSQYSTISGGAGTATVTNYDAANNRISGTFSFKGKYFDGAAFKDSYQTFSGSFADIPIIDPNNPQLPCGGGSSGGISGGGTAGGGSGTSTSTITYTNASFTSVNITVNGLAKTIAVGSSAQYTGTPNAAATGTATTSGKTSSGTVVGNTISWTLSNTFPASGNANSTLNVGGDFFFLKVKNTSSKTINKLYVNYGLVSQTLDNVVIANDGLVYNLGYYKAYTNSNVRGENGTTSWSWNTLSLPFTTNQSFTVQAN